MRAAKSSGFLSALVLPSVLPPVGSSTPVITALPFLVSTLVGVGA